MQLLTQNNLEIVLETDVILNYLKFLFEPDPLRMISSRMVIMMISTHCTRSLGNDGDGDVGDDYDIDPLC